MQTRLVFAETVTYWLLIFKPCSENWSWVLIEECRQAQHFITSEFISHVIFIKLINHRLVLCTINNAVLCTRPLLGLLKSFPGPWIIMVQPPMVLFSLMQPTFLSGTLLKNKRVWWLSHTIVIQSIIYNNWPLTCMVDTWSHILLL